MITHNTDVNHIHHVIIKHKFLFWKFITTVLRNLAVHVAVHNYAMIQNKWQ